MTDERTVTVAELDSLVDDIFTQKAKIKEMEAALTTENKKLGGMETQVGTWLTELGRVDYKHPSGSLYFQEGWRFNMPQTPEDKQLFFDELKKRGIYDQMASVHSGTYNAFLVEELDAAVKEGRGMEFSFPGVPRPTFYKLLRSRKSSKGKSDE